jgi:hypothetical protein
MRKKHKFEGAVELPLGSLKLNPVQAVLYPELRIGKIEQSASFLELGMCEPMSVLPDGTVVHVGDFDLVEAARRLRWKTLPCRVRHDLAAAGPQAAQAHVVRECLHAGFVNTLHPLEPLLAALDAGGLATLRRLVGCRGRKLVDEVYDGVKFIQMKAQELLQMMEMEAVPDREPMSGEE